MPSSPIQGKGATSNACFRQQKPGLTAKGDQRRFVQHDYTDHADKEDELGGLYGHSVVERYELSHYNADSTESKKTKPSPPFPLKIYMILKEVESRGQGDVVSWLPHGRAFFIRNNDYFTKQILPEFFKKCKISSFFRQLNLYGFIRLTAGFDTGAYYHEYFLRGKPFLTMNIVRTKVKGTKIRAASSPQDEPDFYSMPVLPDFPKMQTETSIRSNLQPPSIPVAGTSVENALQAQVAASVMHGNQPISIPQRLSADYNQLQAASRLSSNPLSMQQTSMDYTNPHSFAHMANDQTSVAAMFESPRFIETMSSSPIYDDVIRSRIRSNSMSVISDPSFQTMHNSLMSSDAIRNRIRENTISTISDPNFNQNPLYPVRTTSDTSDPHHYHNQLALSNIRLHDEAMLHRTSSSLPSAAHLNQEAAYPTAFRQGSRESDFTRNLQMMMASSAPDDAQQMTHVARALEMRQPTMPPNRVPAENMPSHLMQTQMPSSAQRRPRSLSDIVNQYLEDQGSKP